VKLAVEGDELLDVDAAFDLVLDLVEPQQIARRQERQALGQRQRLELFPHLVHDVDLVHGEPRHPGALVGLLLDQALGGEHLQRLADREPAGAELLGDVLLADPLAGADASAEDGAAQVGGDAVGRDGHLFSFRKKARPCG
jgi:hypothetical protein